MKLIYIRLALLVSTITIFSCGKDYLSTSPVRQFTEKEMFKNVANTRVALAGTYSVLFKQITGQEQDGHTSVMYAMDLMGEDIVWPIRGTDPFYATHRLTTFASEMTALNAFTYKLYYRLIANANLVLEHIDNVPDATEEDKKSIKGECLGLRAFGYHMLVQLFGKKYDIVNEANNKDNIAIPLLVNFTLDPQKRVSVDSIYMQINRDLDSAINYLDGKTINGIYRTHIDVRVAQGLKARVALTQGKYQDAYDYAKKAMVGFKLMSNSEYLSGFSNMINDEWIWGVNILEQQVPTTGSFFAFMSSNFNSSHTRANPKLINSALYAKISATDVRKKLWCADTADRVNYPGVIDGITNKPVADQVRFPLMHNKFRVKNPSTRAGDVPFMRIAEMYLIAAEAKAALSLYQDAANELLPLAVNRDPQYVSPTGAALDAILDRIKEQRRIELWGEGFRFLDLKRRGEDLDRRNTGASVTYALTMQLTNSVLLPENWVFVIPRAEVSANPLIGE